MTEKCPFCGAEKVSVYPDFACGTYESQLGMPGDYGQSEACKDRQIASQAEEIGKLRKLLWKVVEHWHNNGPIMLLSEIDAALKEVKGE